MTDSGVVLVGNAYAQSRSGASMIRHLLCGMLCAALLLLPAGGGANPGDLDPTFGIGGKVTTGIGTDDYGYAVAIQADGKLVVAGETNNDINYDVALVRYNANGTPDATFGTGGKVTTAVGTSDGAAYALAIQADGKLVAAGANDVGNNNYDFARALQRERHARCDLRGGREGDDGHRDARRRCFSRGSPSRREARGGGRYG